MSFNVKLQSSDGQIFDTDIQIASCMKKIANILKNLGPNSVEIIPIENVDSATLEMLLAWAEHHKGDDVETLVLDKQFTIPEWDEEFLTTNQASISNLIRASNELNIHPLLLMGCKKVANMIKGKTSAQIRESFIFVHHEDFVDR